MSNVDNFFKLSAEDIDGNTVPFSKFEGKVCIIVNVASAWGQTKLQYAQLEQLYLKYADQGLVVLAFPCNQFGRQEPGDAEQIKAFVKRLDPAVTFPLFAKIEVNGSNTHPVFEFLKDSLPGIMGTTSIKWNFTKFLVDRDGIPFKRYGTNQQPFEMEEDIKKLLNKGN